MNYSFTRNVTIVMGTTTPNKRPKNRWALYRSMIVVFSAAGITWTFASCINFQPDSCECLQGHSNPAKATQVARNQEPNLAIEPYDGPSRVFTKFEHRFPCFEGEQKLMVETPASQGILFQRPHKTGSTTMVGVVLRLAHNRAKGSSFAKCKHRAMHGTAQNYRYGQRDRSKSFLFSIIRDPTKRMISEFFHFDVTAYEKEPTDANFLNKARVCCHNYYLKELTTRTYVPNGTAVPVLDFAISKGYSTVADLNAAKQSGKPGLTRLLQREQIAISQFGLNYKPEKIVQDILDDYDFIAIMERMDESLVVFQMLLGLTTKEILYTRARSAGGFSNGWKGRPCFYIMKSFLTDGMKQYFASEEWKQTVANDFLMYQAANKSLDRTIASLDREEFDKNLQALQRGLELANENCNGRIRTMCDAGGNLIPVLNRTCYIWAEGCDHDCIDELEL